MINKRNYLGIPLARRRNRRWFVVGFWVLVLSFLGMGSLWIHRNPNWFDHAFLLPWIWVIGIILGGLGGINPGGPVRDFKGRSSDRPNLLDNTVRTLMDPQNREWVKENGPLDERDIRLRNAAHYEAYSALRWMVLLGFLAALAVQHYHFAANFGFVIDPLLVLFVGLVFNWPQTLLLWFEPDMEELHEG